MLLLDYLNANFNDTASWDFSELSAHFMLKFGVNVRNEADLYCFKYNQLEPKWDQLITALCRGVILRYTGGSWCIVSRPFDKFFNYHEGMNALRAPELFMHPDLSMIEKADGTCIQLWYDAVEDRWRISTLKMITPREVNQFEHLTFRQLYWKTVDEARVRDALSHVDKDLTFIFELCCPENQVVTRYTDARVYLLSVRNHQTGDYVDSLAADRYADQLGVRRPLVYPFGFHDEAAMHAFVEQASEDHDTYGQYPEGFVVFVGTAPAFKLKNTAYLRYHACLTGDVRHTFNAIIETYFAGNIDDIEQILSDIGKRYLGHLRAWWLLQMNLITKAITDVYKHADSAGDAKAYALCVQAHVPKVYAPFFYQHRELVCTGKCDAGYFEKWFLAESRGRSRYLAFEKTIKAHCEKGLLVDGGV